MAKRRRDAEETKKELIQAVGEIWRELGFGGLTLNKVANWLRKSKTLINHHFGSLNGLIKAYINSKDYWKPIFDRFRPGENPGPEELEQLFTGLMQANFDAFARDEEMQQIILAQVSQRSALLKAISDQRELEGDRLLKLTDVFFRGSGLNFRGVIALILGGSYYIIWHARNNRSKVSGIDINWEHDRQELKKTIEQVIGLFWNEIRSKKNMDNKYQYEQLDKLTDARADLTDEPIAEEVHPDFASEVKRLEQELPMGLAKQETEVQLRTYLAIHYDKLSALANKVYRQDWEENAEALLLVELSEMLRRPVAVHLAPETSLPALLQEKESNRLRVYWRQVSHELNLLEVDEQLIELLGFPLRQFIKSARRANWQALEYLNRYLAALEECGSQIALDELDIWETMVRINLNHARTQAWISTRISLQGKDMGDDGRKQLLTLYKHRFEQWMPLTAPGFDPDSPSLKETLLCWIEGELASGSQGPLQLPLNTMKLRFRMNILQSAFWNKMLLDNEVYVDENLDSYAEKVAYNFSTKGQDELSAASIKSKFYGKDPAVIDYNEALLVKMLEYVRKLK
ncbi:hypothetical protein SAMN05216436_12291 [bacterium A37T11]|nr:hypothetical protein SAMN05216436_12291 [bacterium A37T11]